MNLGGEVNNHSSQPPNLHTIHKEVNLNQKVNQRGDPSALLILLLYLWKNIININNCNSYNYYLIQKNKNTIIIQEFKVKDPPIIEKFEDHLLPKKSKEDQLSLKVEEYSPSNTKMESLGDKKGTFQKTDSNVAIDILKLEGIIQSKPISIAIFPTNEENHINVILANQLLIP